MTKFGKILAILTLFFSLAFLGFTWVNYSGGMNWERIARDPELIDNFSFSYTGGENPTWNTTSRSGEALPAVPSLPAAIIAARKTQIAEQGTKIDDLDGQIPQLQAATAQKKALIASDLAALAERQTQLMTDLKTLNTEIDRLTSQADEVARDTVEVQSTTSLRREDVYRLRQQLAELQTDKFHIAAQRGKLEDLLTRMKGVNDKLQRRKDQLIESGAKPDYDPEPEPPAPANGTADSAE